MGIVRKYYTTVKEIQNPLKDIFTATFLSEKKFIFLPGQFLHLTLDDYSPNVQWPESRCFSMQSEPDAKFLKITFAIKGRFTQQLAEELHSGKNIWLKLPYGDLFQRQHSKNNCVFIAGGTGITPFLSLFGNSLFAQYQNPKLYFGIRSKEYNIFIDELIIAKKINQQFIINIVNQNKDGILDIEKIYSENKNSTYFISGPPAMISSFKNFLVNQKCSEEKVITDDWE